MSGQHSALMALLGRPVAPVRAAAEIPSYQKQGPRFTPKALEAYAQAVGEPWPKACVRCFVVVEHWVTRVFADWREVRLCRDCWRQWDARQKARAA